MTNATLLKTALSVSGWKMLRLNSSVPDIRLRAQPLQELIERPRCCWPGKSVQKPPYYPLYQHLYCARQSMRVAIQRHAAGFEQRTLFPPAPRAGGANNPGNPFAVG